MCVTTLVLKRGSFVNGSQLNTTHLRHLRKMKLDKTIVADMSVLVQVQLIRTLLVIRNNTVMALDALNVYSI